VITLLDRHKLRDNTLVIVLTEQGNSFPFAKWTCYNIGLASGCIVRWPGKVKQGVVSDALIEYVDVVPTFLDAAGLTRPEILDGRSFVPVLSGNSKTHKSEVYGLQTTRGIINGADFYGVRSVRNDRYRYILNLTPEMTFENAATHNKMFKTWEEMATQGDETAKRLVHDYQHRPAEELYDCEADPWNRTNLISEAKLAGVRTELRTKLDAWMKQQGDEGQATEMNALQRMPRKRGKEDVD